MRWAKYGCAFMLVWLVSAGGGMGAESVQKIVFADTPGQPYIMGEIGGEPTGGIVVELVRELFGRLGIEVEINLVPWKRALKMARHGRCDGIMLLMRNPEREQFLVYSDRLFESRELLYSRADQYGQFSWQKFEDLKPYTIGLVSGYAYGSEFMEAIETLDLKVEYAPSTHINFQKLFNRRIDFYLEDQAVAETEITVRPEWRSAFRPVVRPVSSYDYYMAFSKSSPAIVLIPQINRILTQMKQDAFIDTLLGRMP